ncbi:MAG: response regulator [Bacteroidota bacterium]
MATEIDITENLRLASEYYDKGEFDRALLELDRVVRVDPENENALVARTKMELAKEIKDHLKEDKRRKEVVQRRKKLVEESQNLDTESILRRVEEEAHRQRDEELQRRAEEEARQREEDVFYRYFLALVGAWRDGILSEQEKEYLSALRTLLEISDEKHNELEQKVKHDAYVAAVKEAWRFGDVSPEEEQILRQLRDKFGITMEEHLGLEALLLWELRAEQTKGIIVAVDDDPLILRLVMMNLKKFGYTVETFETCEAALEYLKTARPDLILSDVIFPRGMNGYEFYEKVRQNPLLMAVPFISMSVRADRPFVLTGLKLGIDEYVTKPVDLSLLLASIEGKVRHYRKIRANKIL